MSRSMTESEFRDLALDCYEFIAGPESVAKPPPIPIYCFLFDLNSAGSQNQFLETSCQILHDLISNSEFPPQKQECKICVIGYDTAIHYFCLKNEYSQPKMFTVNFDFQDLPLPIDHFVCPFEDCKANLLNLLENMKTIVSHSKPIAAPSELGLTLIKLKKIYELGGGKTVIFQSAPNLSMRNPDGTQIMPITNSSSVSGMNKLLGVSSTYYRNIASELAVTRTVTIDLFMCADSYKNTINIGQLCSASSGFFYYYPHFDSKLDYVKLKTNIKSSLCANYEYENFTRLRVSKGFYVEELIGNCLLGAPDMVGIPFSSTEKTFMFRIAKKPRPQPEITVHPEMFMFLPQQTDDSKEISASHIILQVFSYSITWKKDCIIIYKYRTGAKISRIDFKSANCKNIRKMDQYYQ